MIGKLITFEGVDGSGKSTLAQRLAQDLGAIPLSSPYSGPYYPWWKESPEPEKAFHAYASIAHLEREVILPALERGQHVVTDRWYYSSIVYGGAPYPTTLRKPDVIFFLDIPEQVAIRRIKARHPEADPFFGMTYRELRERYWKLLHAEEDRWVWVEADYYPLETLYQNIRQLLVAQFLEAA